MMKKHETSVLPALEKKPFSYCIIFCYKQSLNSLNVEINQIGKLFVEFFFIHITTFTNCSIHL